MVRNICWRLLAAALIIFLGRPVLRGQDLHGRGPAEVDRSVTNVPETLRWPVLAAPLWEPGPPVDFLAAPPIIFPTFFPIKRGPNPTPPGGGTFAQIASTAGIIFAGRVVSVGRAKSPLTPGPASTSITFQVEHATRGVTSGERLTIHEWCGLWARGEHYRVGERVVLFLFPPSRLGLTSPVAGRLGRFEVIRGRARLTPEHAAAFAAERLFEGKVEISYADLARSLGQAGAGWKQEE
jgi:hypothetical protein